MPVMERTDDSVSRKVRKTDIHRGVNIDHCHPVKPKSHCRDHIGDKTASNALLRPKSNIVSTHQCGQKLHDLASRGLAIERTGMDFERLWIGECIRGRRNAFQKRRTGSIEDRDICCIQICQE